MPSRKRCFLLDRVKYPGSYPGRTRHCKHKDCFDIFNVELREGVVTCPICNLKARKDELVEDRDVCKELGNVRWNRETEAWFRKRLCSRVFEPVAKRVDDPISGTTIVIPVRGQDCDHRRCFDLKTYYMSYAQHAGTCPVCQKRAPLSELVIDQSAEMEIQRQGGVTAESSINPVDVETYKLCGLPQPTVKVEDPAENQRERELGELRLRRQELEMELAQVAEREASLQQSLVSNKDLSFLQTFANAARDGVLFNCVTFQAT
jgi:hypothetical protein